MSISIDQNAQLAQFIRFADAAADKDVARLEPVGLAGHEIAATKLDSVHAFIRSRDAKQANDTVRNLFRQAVADLFGGESRIPASVKKAMLLSDYGKGKPLTARRILAVKIAIEAVKDSIDVAGDNQKIVSAVKTGRFHELPPDIAAGLDDVLAEIGTRGGKGMPQNRAELVDFIGMLRLGNAIKAHADETGRPLTRADVRDSILSLVRGERFVEVAKLNDYLGSGLVVLHGQEPSRWLACTLFTALPAFARDMEACRNEDDFRTAFVKHRNDIADHIETIAAAKDCKARAGEILLEEFAKATGFGMEDLRERVPLKEFTSGAAYDLTDKICDGKSEAKTPAQIEAAFRDMARRVVQEHVDAAKEVDSIPNLPESFRKALRNGAYFCQSVKKYKVSQYAPLAARIDLSKLVAAAKRAPLDLHAIASALKEVFVSLAQTGVDTLGLEVWRDKLGADGQQPFGSIVFLCALAKEPAVAGVIGANALALAEATSGLFAPDEQMAVGMITSALTAAMEVVS